MFRSFSLWLIFILCLANNVNYILSSRSCTDHMVIVNTQWNQHRSSGKGKLKLVIITFINRHFLAKKKVVAGGKLLFLFDARKTSFITTLFYALLQTCRQIMLAKTIWYLFQSNRGIVVKCKPKKKGKRRWTNCRDYLCYLRLNQKC